MTVVVSDEGVSPKNNAVRDLQFEAAGFSIVFTDDVYAVQIDNGNPWFDVFSVSVQWPTVTAIPATWTPIEV